MMIFAIFIVRALDRQAHGVCVVMFSICLICRFVPNHINDRENRRRERLKGEEEEGNAAGDVKIFIDSIFFFKNCSSDFCFSSLVTETYEI